MPLGSYPRVMLTLTAALVGSVALSLPQTTPAQRPSLEQFFKIRAPATPVYLPDGSLLLRDWPDGVWQLYRVAPRLETKTEPDYSPGAATFTRLTDFPDGLANFFVSPDGKRAILMHSAGGNENTQLSLMEVPLQQPTAKPTLKPVLANTKVQAAVQCWLPDSSGFVYSANDATPSDFHLYRYDFASAKAIKLLAKPGSWEAKGITKDGSRVLVEEFKSASDITCYELDTAGGTLKDITIRPTEGGAAACAFVGYLPDENSALMISDAVGGTAKLFLKDLGTGGTLNPVPALNKHEIDAAMISGGRDLLAVASNEDGYGVPHVYELPAFKPLPFPKTDAGVIGGTDFRGATLLWSPGGGGRTLSWSNSNARNPGSANVTTWPADGPKAAAPITQQVTYVESQGIDLAGFPLPDLIRYKSFDGTEIPAFVFLPPGYQKGKPIPFVVMYHGGPEGQHRPIFSITQQYLLNEGFGILLPNVRGSTGYGREFQMMDDYKNRWNSVRDGVDAARWLVTSGYSAPGKIATLGGSYGGFMSVACLVEDQERVDAGTQKERLFGAGVNLVGIVNFKTFLEKTAGYRRKLREAEYGPLSDPDFLSSVSSMTRVDKIKTPMFIGHGFNDPRVPVEEAMQLAIALKDRGVPVNLFIAPDEGHGFQKLENRIYFYSRVVPFLRETIGK